MGYNKD